MGNTVRIRNGMSNATEGDILGNASDIIKDLGVVDLAGGHLLVTEDSPKGMTVQVAGGVVYVPNSNYDELDSDTPKFYPVVCSSEVLTVDNNVSGSTRYDIVCVKVDKTIVPDADADNIATKVVVKGTPGAGVPATPANHYKLAEVEVVNGETEIEDSMITDTRAQVAIDERFIELTEDTRTDIDGLIGGDGSNLKGITLDSTLSILLGVLGVDLDEIGITEINTILSSLWLPCSETWTRTGNHTFTVSGDKTLKFRKGARIRYKDGGGYEYGVVINSSYSAPNTTVTLATNNDYSMAAVTITDRYVSYGENPEGYPDWFAYTPTLSSTSGTLTTATASGRFRVIGKTIEVWNSISITNKGTAAGAIIVTSPVANGTTNIYVGQAIDASSSGAMGSSVIYSTGSSIYIYKYDFTTYWVNGYGITSMIRYEI